MLLRSFLKLYSLIWWRNIWEIVCLIWMLYKRNNWEIMILMRCLSSFSNLWFCLQTSQFTLNLVPLLSKKTSWDVFKDLMMYIKNLMRNVCRLWSDSPDFVFVVLRSFPEDQKSLLSKLLLMRNNWTVKEISLVFSLSFWVSCIINLPIQSRWITARDIVEVWLCVVVHCGSERCGNTGGVCAFPAEKLRHGNAKLR